MRATDAPRPLRKEGTMTPLVTTYRSRFAAALFELLDPIPFGLFVGTLIFDITYALTRNVFWGKGAAWLVSVGLLFAIIPRFINLVQVWVPSSAPLPARRFQRLDFWFYLVGIVAAILNAFVHSRDAYAMVPQNVVLSAITVAFLSLALLMRALARFAARETRHE